MADPHSWNPWHGCVKYSEGCDHCYMYALDQVHKVPESSSAVFRTQAMRAPLMRDRNGAFRVRAGRHVRVNMTSDTFIEDADAWRDEMWDVIRTRPDVLFHLLTKRAHRIADCLPTDWGSGWANVELHVSCENQRAFDERWPHLRDVPAKHKGFNLAPLIGPIDMRPALKTGQIDYVCVGGEGFGGTRPCHYEWVKRISDDCRTYGANFIFSSTGEFFAKGGKVYRMRRKQVQKEQAIKSGLGHWDVEIDYGLSDPAGSLPLGFDAPAPPIYNLAKCPTCPSVHICSGCRDCPTCKNDPHGSIDEVLSLREEWVKRPPTTVRA